MKSFGHRLWKRLKSPLSWSRTTRRLFLLATPISLPLWLGALAMVGLLLTLRASVRPLVAFWSDPPKRRHSYYGYLSRHFLKRKAAPRRAPRPRPANPVPAARFAQAVRQFPPR